MDLIFVTFNSEQWIRSCFDSLLESHFDLNSLNVFVIDNHSTDKTVEYLEDYRDRFCVFKSYTILVEQINHGFGQANNIAAWYGSSDLILFVNIDTRFYPDTLEILNRSIHHSAQDIGIWEIRQFPYEHPKKYNVITMETSWASGAAFAIRRKIFVQAGGFDKIFFMYAEDVDLSWRIRLLGYKIKYVPKAAVEHYTYSKPYEVKPLQYCSSLVNNLYLRYRYGNLLQQFIGNVRVIASLLHISEHGSSRTMLLKKYIRHFSNISSCQLQLTGKKQVARFIGTDYEHHRSGAFYVHKRIIDGPDIMVIISNKSEFPFHLLLRCLRNQTYSHIKLYYWGEQINFADADIDYIDPNTRISELHAPYFSVLDGNFLYYADHFETLIGFMRCNHCLGATGSYENFDFQETLSGILFHKEKLLSFKPDLTIADIFQTEYKNILKSQISYVNVETRKVWRH